jgi:RHS repeat-associated protein
MVFDQTGTLANVKRHDYLPYGEELFAGIGGRSVAQGYSASDGVRQHFTQKERDVETGLDYFLARYYSSIQGRFTSPDEFTGGPDELYYFADDASANPTFYADLRNPQSLNKYQYSYNNPLRYVDPDGHEPDQNPKCKCPTDQTIIDWVTSLPDTVADATGITAAADAIRKYGPTVINEIMSHGGQSAAQQDLQDLRSLRQQNREQTQPTQQDPATGGGQTPEKTKNLADAEKKGIPKDQLGPSGKPKVHTVNHPTKKRAEDAARADGQGKPAKDTRPKKGGPHFHPTNKDGTRKKGKHNVHHEYPN